MHMHAASGLRLPGATLRIRAQICPGFSSSLKSSRSRYLCSFPSDAVVAATAVHIDTPVTALQLMVAVTVLAASLPQIIAVIKPCLLPIRCRTCMGATTNLCTECGSRGKVGGLFTSQPLARCQQCEGLGRITCNACKGKGMVNSWLWQTDMSGPKTPARKSVKASRGQNENTPLFRNSEGSEDDSLPESFPYPRLGDNTFRKSFRDLVKEQQKEWRV